MKTTILLVFVIIFSSCSNISKEEADTTEKKYIIVSTDGTGTTIEQEITQEQAEELFKGTKSKNILYAGTWFNEKDHKAGIEITVDRISLFYTLKDSRDHDWYDYYITDKHPKADTSSKPGDFLYLTKDGDTLSYEILNEGVNGTLSLLHLDSGKLHIYKNK